MAKKAKMKKMPKGGGTNGNQNYNPPMLKKKGMK